MAWQKLGFDILFSGNLPVPTAFACESF